MKILVTGAAGFLGRRIALRLTAEGHDVTGFDLRSVEATTFPSVEGDLLDLESLSTAARGQDVICHVGAIGDVYLAAERPSLAAQVNVTGSANVAQVAREVGARVVYASTWEVYGKARYEPVDESHPCEPDHPYNITKLAGERMLLAADRLQGVPVISLRLGTAYGPGLRPNSVFRIFFDRARGGEPLIIQGDGSQSRQFTHADDIARAFLLASESDAHGIALNVVAPEAVTIGRLAEIVSGRYGAELRFGEPRPGDIPSARVSSERAREVIGWEPGIPFETGFQELMDDWESRSG